MKKMMSMALAAVLAVSLAVPAYAYDGSAIPTKSWSGWFQWWDSSGGTSEEDTAPAVTLAAPAVTESRFYHKGAVASMKNRLQIKWDAVEGAERYEIQMTKADGTVESYTASTNLLMIKNAACPKVYVQSTSTWKAATVRVRAVAGDVVGAWSVAATIGCDAIH